MDKMYKKVGRTLYNAYKNAGSNIVWAAKGGAYGERMEARNQCLTERAKKPASQHVKGECDISKF
jgi:hypothetical protein